MLNRDDYIYRVIHNNRPKVRTMTLTGKHGHSEHGRDIDGLDVEELYGVDGRH